MLDGGQSQPDFRWPPYELIINRVRQRVSISEIMKWGFNPLEGPMDTIQEGYSSPLVAPHTAIDPAHVKEWMLQVQPAMLEAHGAKWLLWFHVIGVRHAQPSCQC